MYFFFFLKGIFRPEDQRESLYHSKHLTFRCKGIQSSHDENPTRTKTKRSQDRNERYGLMDTSYKKGR